jgi:hypothetical protein
MPRHSVFSPKHKHNCVSDDRCTHPRYNSAHVSRLFSLLIASDARSVCRASPPRTHAATRGAPPPPRCTRGTTHPARRLQRMPWYPALRVLPDVYLLSARPPSGAFAPTALCRLRFSHAGGGGFPGQQESSRTVRSVGCGPDSC